jgi:hypothetical protein
MSNATTQGPAVHEWTGPTGVKFRDVREPSGTYYHDTTPRPVVQALEAAFASKAYVRLFLGDATTGKDWLEENDVAGYLGRSTGPVKVLLLLKSKQSSGGPAILCDCIVRLLVDGREVYRHPGYVLPTIVIESDPACPEYPWRALCGVGRDAVAVEYARFKTQLAAEQWRAFMRGERRAP